MKPAGTICTTTSGFDIAGNAALMRLAEKGFATLANPHKRQLSEAEAKALLGEHDPIGLLAGVEPLTDAVMASAPSLRVISRVGAGLDNVDLEAAKARGIAVRSTPDAPAAAVAELTLALMLALLRKVALLDRQMRDGKWAKQTGRMLAGKTVGIIGYGRIGRRVGDLVSAFGAIPAPYDPVTAPGTLEGVLAHSDVVTLHLPLNAEARNIISEAALARMKPNALLINVARGGLVDEAALGAALREGRLGGAALDVFQVEPYGGPLIGLQNVVLTPHIGSATEETRRTMEAEAGRNLIEALGLDDGP